MSDGEGGVGQRLILAGVGVVLLAGFVWGVIALTSGPASTPKKIVPDLTMVKIAPLPPPPPPPPPPKEPPPPEPQKLIETPKMQDQVKPDKPTESAKPSANAAPPGPLGADVTSGVGPGGFAAGGGGGGDGGGGGSLAGWYGGIVGASLYDAVSKDGRLDHAKGLIEARIWLAPDGTPTKVELDTKFDDPRLNKAFEEIVMREWRPSEPPPQELPQPVHIRLHAQPTRS